MTQPIRVALLGCGTVGSEVVRLMHKQSEDLTARIGAPLELVGIAVRRPNRDRGDLGVPRSL
ncbi:MAG TPA: homoserine dehydrogenase, partial [Micromonosporaceae bacterium]